jgi:DNA processing protein
MKKIIENGAVISELLPTTAAIKSNFVKRNYLLSAWCDKLLLVEVAEKSGALTTAKFAHENSTEVYAVPNGIYSKESTGTNKLIQSYAKIYLTPSQLVERENCIETSAYRVENLSNLTPFQRKILAFIRKT